MRRTAALVSLVLLIALGGCTAGTGRTEVIPPERQPEATGTLTPLQRGEVRRAALRAAEPAIAAFLADDADEIARSWDAAYQKLWNDYRDENAESGHTRIRSHERISLDVTDMSADGTEVLVRYVFVDHSYTKDAHGNVTSAPLDKQTEFQLTMTASDGVWTVKRLIAGDEFYK